MDLARADDVVVAEQVASLRVQVRGTVNLHHHAQPSKIIRATFKNNSEEVWHSTEVSDGSDCDSEHRFAPRLAHGLTAWLPGWLAACLRSAVPPGLNRTGSNLG